MTNIIVSQASDIICNIYSMNQSKEQILIDYLFHVFVLQKKDLRIVSSFPVAKNMIEKRAEED